MQAWAPDCMNCMVQQMSVPRPYGSSTTLTLCPWLHTVLNGACTYVCFVLLDM